MKGEDKFARSPRTNTNCLQFSPVCAYTEGVFEAVRRSFLVALPVLLSPLTEEQGLLVQEQVSLHGLKPGQVLDLGVTFFMLRPHAEGALHQQATQIRQVTLEKGKERKWHFSTEPIRKATPAQANQLNGSISAIII